MIIKYWPKITDTNESQKSNNVKKQNKLKIDKSNIEDAEFTELDDD